MKTWKPDTCGCEVEEIYNGTEITGGGVVLKKCQPHASIPDDELYGVLYSNVDGENKRKNQMLRILLGHEDIKDLGLEEAKVNDDGSDNGIGLKKGIEYKWSFSGDGKDRVLNVEVKGANLLKAKKDEVKALCDTKFGSNKVNML